MRLSLAVLALASPSLASNVRVPVRLPALPAAAVPVNPLRASLAPSLASGLAPADGPRLLWGLIPFDPLRSAADGAGAMPDAAGRAVPRHRVEAYDRSRFSRSIRADVAKRRQALIDGYADPRTIRFSIPKSKAYVDGIVKRLLEGSALANDVAVQVNDGSWGMPSASLAAGVLRVDAELIAIMSSEDEVAAVIAHELAHHVRAHAEQLASTLRWFPRRGGGDMLSSPAPTPRELRARWKHEQEADEVGLLILANAGYDPSAAAAALEAVRREMDTEPRYEFFRGRRDDSHPPLELRLRVLGEAMARAGLTAGTRAPLDAEVFQELAGRHRPGDDTTAADLYQHYRRAR